VLLDSREDACCDLKTEPHPQVDQIKKLTGPGRAEKKPKRCRERIRRRTGDGGGKGACQLKGYETGGRPQVAPPEGWEKGR